MKVVSEEIDKLIEQYIQLMESNKNINTKINLDGDKWSINQIFGHLIDSASNNHQRITRIKIQNNCSFPDYNKDEWIEVGNYNNKDYNLLFSLFTLYNRLLSQIIKDIESSIVSRCLFIKWND